MSSFALPWVEINVYLEAVGPKRGRPYRPERCEFCRHRRVWFNGWRLISASLLDGGFLYRFADGLPVQRVKCASCKMSWTMMPPFVTRQRSYAADVNEEAAFAYLSDPCATYRLVAARYGCAPSALWLWVGWMARLETPGALVAEAVRHDPDSPAPHLIPRIVPQSHHPKALSRRRARAILRTYQMLVALACLARAGPPPSDPSLLRDRLASLFPTFRDGEATWWPYLSPPSEQSSGESGR